MPKISEIYIYPIKSLSGISLQESMLEERGLQHDRRWVLVDENNKQITQREKAEMALIAVSIEKNGLKVRHRTKDFGHCIIPFEPQTNENSFVRIWDDEVLATRVSNEVDKWFQDSLQLNCRLFYQPTTSFRAVDKNYALDNEQVSLADGYPVLLAGQASLDDLNERLLEKIAMLRFRPNLVCSESEPFAEDTWTTMKIGDTAVKGVKNCARCPIPNINPETAEITKETIKTLASYRSRTNAEKKVKVFFGQNLLVKKIGIIRVGDEIIF